MYLLGYDIGSSSVKAALVDAQSLETLGTVHYPETEMDIIARQTGWAEQHPEIWWENVLAATHKLFSQYSFDRKSVVSIGVSYQMHGLVVINEDKHVLRPSIIWCDSRAVGIGETALYHLGKSHCFDQLLNAPGNFTASKLKWVMDNEPAIYDQIHKVLLPGDFINMKLTGEINTTVAALSEGVFWNFAENQLSEELLDFYGISTDLMPEVVKTCGIHGRLTEAAANFLGLPKGIPVSYRAGDQPNNAMSLNVLKPGEIAATGGTSGVVFGVTDEPLADPQSRLNTFAHVNHSAQYPRFGLLLCINGAGSQYGWIKKMVAKEGASYLDMEQLLTSVPVNSDGLCLMPFGNGAERMLNNRDIGSRMLNLNFNRHGKAHIYRAALEGIAFAFAYGIRMMQDMGVTLDTIRVGNDNLFQSSVFSTTLASVLNCKIEMLEVTGAVGAARASAVGTGAMGSLGEAMSRQKIVHTFEAAADRTPYKSGFRSWKSELSKLLNWKENNQVNDHEHSYWRETIL